MIVISTSAATHLYSFTTSGAVEDHVVTSITLPASSADASDAENMVFTNNNVVYVANAQGETIGQYAAGSTLNSVTIARESGLYFATGGDDNVLYIFSKYASSDWTLGQATQFLASISEISMSDIGSSALVKTGDVTYIFVRSSLLPVTPTPTPTGGGGGIIAVTYYLSLQVVNDLSTQMTNESVLVDHLDEDNNVVSQTLTTDSNGRVVFEVTPTTLYTVTLSNGYVYKYKASNLQLQTVTLVKSYSQIKPSIDYNVWYDADTETIYMYYEDASNLTDEITFTIYDDAGNELWTQTHQGSTLNTSHTFATVMRANMFSLRENQLAQNNNLTPEKLGTVYQVNMEGSSEDKTVLKNTQFVGTTNGILNFPVDPLWKNIFFTLLLMVMCGVFGWIGSVKGAVGIAGVAVAFNYLGLISIPLFWLWGIVFFAFLTVYAYASQQEG